MVRTPPANAGDVSLILGSGRSPEEGNGNPLQCSCLENPRDGEPSGLRSMGSTQSWTRLKQLSSSSSRKKDTQQDYEMEREGEAGWQVCRMAHYSGQER